MHPLPAVIAADTAALVERIAPTWRQLAGAEVLLTGGTGFVGTWLLATALTARRHLHLDLGLTVLSRHPDRFLQQHPWAMDPAITWIKGDVRTPFPEPPRRPTHLLHAATDTDARRNQADPETALRTPIEGTTQAIHAARRWHCRRMLLVSSGAIYGTQPPGLPCMGEDFLGGPTTLDPAFAYHEGKRGAEMLATIAQHQGDLQIPIARLFAFVGPYLPLNTHFAVGNLIGDGLAGRDLIIQGDGRTVRSYLYAADMAGWLWTLLAKGQGGRAYNVGSDQAIDIAGLAQACAAEFSPPPTIQIMTSGDPSIPSPRYVPSIVRAREELGLAVWTDLPTALRRTIHFHRQARS